MLKQRALYFLRCIKGLTVIYLGYPQKRRPLWHLKLYLQVF